MKTLLFCMLPVAFLAPVNSSLKAPIPKPVFNPSTIGVKKEISTLGFQDKDEPGKMRSIVFKSQEYCRAEIPYEFEYDVRFNVVSATVYFTGANFTGIEKGTINSNSLKPIRHMMGRCIPGTRVVFDNVKVVGPDKKIRTIPGLNLLLY